ncbi:MAG: ADP-ribosylglycohydrolase family protein [Thermomicrobiales bacterium]
MDAATTRRDRIAGTFLGLAAGDALGAGYEFGPPLPDDMPIALNGGGGFAWEPGEWTDDTGMAVAIALAMRDTRASGATTSDQRLLDDVVAHWGAWTRVTKDIGNQTAAVFSAAGVGGMRGTTAARVRAEAQAFHDRSGRSAGNGSLMRTAPIPLFTLNAPPEEAADLAAAIGELTHTENTASEACVLWSLAIRHAIETGTLDIRVGIPLLDTPRQEDWRGLIAVAEAKTPRDFRNNGWVVEAFQAAWSAIVTTRAEGQSPGDHLVRALEAAVRGGRDTDTVAAIAGSLLGAAYGASAVPAAWTAIIHGWPGMDATDLVALANAITPS